jgi:hypothetical protein
MRIITIAFAHRIDPYGPPVVPVMRYGAQEITLPAWNW